MIAVCAVITAMAAGRDTYTVIVSLDAFRWDYSEAYDTPFFDYIASEGTKAVMMPSFPSKTFPNHYTLATGLYPDHHGIVANSFKDRAHGKVYSLGDSVTRSDPSYYGGDPIWLTAKHQGVKTATVYWVGSDVAIEGEHANYWKDYLKDRLTFEQRIDEVVNLLSKPQSSRPHLVMAYFEEPDHSGHRLRSHFAAHASCGRDSRFVAVRHVEQNPGIAHRRQGQSHCHG
jgi:predicted AlkP superfamily pyrophosphatase or phosphodiesterase